MNFGSKGRTKMAVVTPPRVVTADVDSIPFGQACVLPLVANTPVYVDLRTLFPRLFGADDADLTVGIGAPGSGPQGAVGSALTILADGTDIGYAVAPSLAVAQANPPTLATTGAVDGNGVYTGAPGAVHRLLSGQSTRVSLQVGQVTDTKRGDRFLAVVPVGAGFLRFHISSEAGLYT